MKISMNEQDMIDVLCWWGADRHRTDPMEVQAELRFQQSIGISAEITWKHRTTNPLYVTEQEVIDNTADYLSRRHLFPADRMTIELVYDQAMGFAAEIEIR